LRRGGLQGASIRTIPHHVSSIGLHSRRGEGSQIRSGRIAAMQSCWPDTRGSGSLEHCWMCRNGNNHGLLDQLQEQKKRRSCRFAAKSGVWVIMTEALGSAILKQPDGSDSRIRCSRADKVTAASDSGDPRMKSQWIQTLSDAPENSAIKSPCQL